MTFLPFCFFCFFFLLPSFVLSLNEESSSLSLLLSDVTGVNDPPCPHALFSDPFFLVFCCEEDDFEVKGNSGNSSPSALVGLPLTKVVGYDEVLVVEEKLFTLDEVGSLREEDWTNFGAEFFQLSLEVLAEVASEGNTDSFFPFFLDSAIAAILSQT
jgi:hypothetical protein